jgi:hypothetical protein
MKKLILVAMLLLCASVAHAGPLADSIKWGLFPAAGYALDHTGSVYFSQHPDMNCYESNLMFQNSDGTMNGPKSFAVKAGITAGYVAGLYLAKRLGWKPAEFTLKGLMLAQASQSTYYGYRAFHACR